MALLDSRPNTICKSTHGVCTHGAKQQALNRIGMMWQAHM